MTLVIVIRHIDLSVGFLSGFLAAVATIGYGPVPPALVCGHPAGIGARHRGRIVHGLPGGAGGDPSLCRHAGRLVGLPGVIAACTCGLRARSLLRTRLSTRSAMAIFPTSFLPTPAFLPGVHKLTLLLGLAAIILYIVSEINSRRKKQAYNFEVLPTEFVHPQIGLCVDSARRDHLGARRLQWPLMDGRDHVDRRGRVSVHDDPDGAGPAYLCRSAEIQKRRS